ncbi:MAG TPA: hypothetical protein VGD24_01140, partial [Gallionella sp.]
SVAFENVGQGLTPEQPQGTTKPPVKVAFLLLDVSLLKSFCLLVGTAGIGHPGQRVVVRRLAAVRLECPAHPAPVPDADSIPCNSNSTSKNDTARVPFLFVGGDGGN